MGSMQATQRKEQQRQHQLAATMWRTGEQRPSGCWLARGDRCREFSEQTRLMGGCQQQQPSGSLLNVGLHSRRIFSPLGWLHCSIHALLERH